MSLPKIRPPIDPSVEPSDDGSFSRWGLTPLHLAPHRIIAGMAAAVFVAEMLVMFLLSYFPEIPAREESILDAALLTLLLTPAFYLLLYRPLGRHLAERQRNEEKICQLAFYDCVTGLPNRHLFRDRLGQALARAERDGRLFAIAFFDLDHFKQVNDDLGHDAGDQLLSLMARRLSQSLRRGDTAARLGGDEFILLLPEFHNEEDLMPVLLRLSQAIKSPCVLTGREIILSASIGVSLYPRDGKDEETLLRKADQAMYLVKSRGRDGILFYQEAWQGGDGGAGHDRRTCLGSFDAASRH